MLEFRQTVHFKHIYFNSNIVSSAQQSSMDLSLADVKVKKVTFWANFLGPFPPLNKLLDR